MLVKKQPGNIVRMPGWLLGGGDHFKSEILRRAERDGTAWQWNPEVVGFLRAAKKDGRKIVLVVPDDRAAAAWQAPGPEFDEVVIDGAGSPGSGAARAANLEQRFGRKSFDYIGRDLADLPVWLAARNAYVSGGDEKQMARVKTAGPVERIPAQRASVRDWMRALRAHQWSKNLLLLLPLLCAHQWADPVRFWPVILGLVAFSASASSAYIVNDLLDLEADRHHASKRHRPFASGKIALPAGFVAAPLLLAVATVLAALLGWKFMCVFGAYYFVTLFYSMRLKAVALVDVLALAALYGVRILAGGVAARVPVSDWLIMFSLFVFLSLAFAKRFTEIRALPEGAAELKGRGYRTGDGPLIGSMGVGSGYLSVLVLAMYITHPSVTSLYSHPQVLWLACPLLFYWVSRIWMLAHRGELPDDPVLFALHDRQSWLVAVLLLAVVFAAGPK